MRDYREFYVTGKKWVDGIALICESYGVDCRVTGTGKIVEISIDIKDFGRKLVDWFECIHKVEEFILAK